MSVNKLILGDNLEILKGIQSDSVDLIYLDPPFFSNRNYEVIWGDEGEVRSFQDRWSGGIDQYIRWLNERVKQMYRVLKPTGSIFLHCDWHANAHIRVLILDKVFGENNFRNEIIWQRTNNPKGSQFEKRNLGIATDTIYWYSKTSSYFFNEAVAREQLQNGEIAKKYPDFDDKGRFYHGPVLRGKSMGTRPNLVYEYKGFTPSASGWRMVKEKLIELDENGDLGWSSSGKPFRKLRPENDKGNPIYNFWNDINRLYSGSPETIGYPTQKPEKLLKRIIGMASNEGDIVLDPFMGGGTTIAVADKLKRNWIGIDQSVAAVKVTEMRLDKQRDLFSSSFTVQLHKYDYDTLRYKNAFEFESWIIQQFGGTSNTKQRSDYGLDGKMPNDTPIQVKRSDNIGRNVIDNFFAAVQRSDKKLFDKNVSEQKPVGYIIAFSFGKGAVQEVARLQNQENIIIHLVKVEDIVPIAKKPTITVEIKELSRDEKGTCEIAFTASGESEAGIEFYSWDFNYSPPSEGEGGGGFKADVMIDKDGKQTTKFKAGLHTIAVKVVDNDGLEGLEEIKLKVNGVVERQ
ncbi:MAG: site-specific DNA-methyltransferase [Lentimicrobiaceae bacterium]|nr:site-specific DNA-methyltransferase [Lentimicrobiaceae bacterium]